MCEEPSWEDDVSEDEEYYDAVACGPDGGCPFGFACEDGNCWPTMSYADSIINANKRDERSKMLLRQSRLAASRMDSLKDCPPGYIRTKVGSRCFQHPNLVLPIIECNGPNTCGPDKYCANGWCAYRGGWDETSTDRIRLAEDAKRRLAQERRTQIKTNFARHVPDPYRIVLDDDSDDDGPILLE